jgi:7-carboxy-7-deazaguanine synthase
VSDELSLRITEVFHSLQGETNTVGLPTVFVRLTGCPLRCNYCDTAYAFHGGQKVLLGEVVDKVRGYSARYVTVTGGEPLAQPACFELLRALCDLKYKVSLETSGALSVAKVDRRVVKVVDFKTPSSTECERNDYGNIQYLNTQDQVKFVIADYTDYQWSVDCMQRYGLADKCEVLFSPVYQVCKNESLAQWILQDSLPVRFQIQLHKYIWGDEPGR